MIFPGRYRPRHLIRRRRRPAATTALTVAALWAVGPGRAYAYEVKAGDTLSSIARRHGTTVGRLATLNRLSDPNLIVIGQRLRTAGRDSHARAHTISRGETLSSIAARYGTTVAAIAAANDLSNPNLIVAGRTLRIPGGGLPAAPAVPAPAASTGTSVAGALERSARAHGVDGSLVKAVAWQESGWRQSARSSAGAIGVMQVMPATADYVNAVEGSNLDVRSMEGNVELGVRYLRRMQDQMGSTERALAAYYAGPGNVGEQLDPGQQAYVAAVLAHQERYR